MGIKSYDSGNGSGALKAILGYFTGGLSGAAAGAMSGTPAGDAMGAINRFQGSNPGASQTQTFADQIPATVDAISNQYQQPEFGSSSPYSMDALSRRAKRYSL